METWYKACPIQLKEGKYAKEYVETDSSKRESNSLNRVYIIVLYCEEIFQTDLRVTCLCLWRMSLQ